MEDLRFLLPITAGKRPEVDSIATQVEAETSEKLDFRDFWQIPTQRQQMVQIMV